VCIDRDCGVWCFLIGLALSRQKDIISRDGVSIPPPAWLCLGMAMLGDIDG